MGRKVLTCPIASVASAGARTSASRSVSALGKEILWVVRLTKQYLNGGNRVCFSSSEKLQGWLTWLEWGHTGTLASAYWSLERLVPFTPPEAARPQKRSQEASSPPWFTLISLCTHMDSIFSCLYKYCCDCLCQATFLTPGRSQRPDTHTPHLPLPSY